MICLDVKIIIFLFWLASYYDKKKILKGLQALFKVTIDANLPITVLSKPFSDWKYGRYHCLSRFETIGLFFPAVIFAENPHLTSPSIGVDNYRYS